MRRQPKTTRATKGEDWLGFEPDVRQGALLRQELEQFMREELAKRDYMPVYTPHIGKIDDSRQARFAISHRLAGFGRNNE